MRASIRVPADPEGYECVDPVDRGPVRSVWRARHLATGGIRVVSLLPPTDDPALLARIERETQLLTKLTDLAVVRSIEVVRHGSGWALVSEDNGEHSLGEFVGHFGAASAPDAVRALTPVAEALAATHQVKLVHGDVHSGTVLVTGDGSCVIGDYGVSRYLRESPGPVATRMSPMAAPEVRREERALPATDVYGFGRVLLYLLSGDAELTDPLALVSAGSTRPSAALSSVLEQCLRADPLDRPAHGEVLLALLTDTPEFRSNAQGLPALSKRARPDVERAKRPLDGSATHQVSSASDGFTSGRSVRLGSAAVALIALAAFAFAISRSPTSSQDSVSGGEPPPRPARSATVSFTTVLREPTCRVEASGQPVDANGDPLPPSYERIDRDLDGDGCPDRLRWWPTNDGSHGWQAHASLSHREQPVILTLGDVGDQLFVGAWECGPVVTPALYRPATGEVFALNTWPLPGDRLDLVATEVLATHITPTVASNGGCDYLTE